MKFFTPLKMFDSIVFVDVTAAVSALFSHSVAPVTTSTDTVASSTMTPPLLILSKWICAVSIRPGSALSVFALASLARLGGRALLWKVVVR